jgi:hypothetical protein
MPGRFSPGLPDGLVAAAAPEAIRSSIAALISRCISAERSLLAGAEGAGLEAAAGEVFDMRNANGGFNEMAAHRATFARGHHQVAEPTVYTRSRAVSSFDTDRCVQKPHVAWG